VSSLAARIGRVGLDFVVVVVASLVALGLFQIGLAQFAMARFWEPWAVHYPIVGMLAPLAVIALACGLVVGLVVGAIAGKRALLLAACTAFVVFGLLFLVAMAEGGMEWAVTISMLAAPVFIGLGLLLGAWLGCKLRRA
jgi:hypothetical protein